MYCHLRVKHINLNARAGFVYLIKTEEMVCVSRHATVHVDPCISNTIIYIYNLYIYIHIYIYIMWMRISNNRHILSRYNSPQAQMSTGLPYGSLRRTSGDR